MSFNEQITKELNNVYQLTYNLHITKLNDDKINIDNITKLNDDKINIDNITKLNDDKINIDNIINFIQLQIYDVNNLKHQLNESLQNLKKIKQSICNHQYEYDNINYDSIQLVCINCNKLFN